MNARQGRLEKTKTTSALWGAMNLGEEKTIPFNDLVTSFRVEDGKLRTDELVLLGANANWKVGGAVSFAGELDYHVEVELNEQLSDRYRQRIGGELADALAGTSGRLTIDLKVTGPATQPNVAPDMQKMSARIAQHYKAKVKEELDEEKDEIVNKLQDWLKK